MTLTIQLENSCILLLQDWQVRPRLKSWLTSADNILAHARSLSRSLSLFPLCSCSLSPPVSFRRTKHLFAKGWGHTAAQGDKSKEPSSHVRVHTSASQGAGNRVWRGLKSFFFPSCVFEFEKQNQLGLSQMCNIRGFRCQLSASFFVHKERKRITDLHLISYTVMPVSWFITVEEAHASPCPLQQS